MLHLARRGLLESRVVLALLVAAVAAGMGFQVPNSANLDGYRDELLAQGVSAGFGEVRLRPAKRRRFEDAGALATQVTAQESVRVALPFLSVPGAVGRRGRFVGTTVVGVDQTAARLPFRVVAGAAVQPGDARGIVLGAALAQRLGLAVGDSVQLRLILGSADNSLLDEDEVGRHTMAIRGLAAGAFGACGSNVAIVDRAFLVAEVGGQSPADAVLVYSDAPFDAPRLAQALGAALPEVSARAWTEESGFLRSAVEASATVFAVTRAMTVLAVLIPVWALLYVHVLNRQRQVGILCALGFRHGEIFTIYLLQAVLVGVVGVGLGALLGYGLILYFQVHPIFAMDDFVLRPVMAPGTFLWPAGLILSATVGAGVWPAWRAAKVDPARALRGLA